MARKLQFGLQLWFQVFATRRRRPSLHRNSGLVTRYFVIRLIQELFANEVRDLFCARHVQHQKVIYGTPMDTTNIRILIAVDHAIFRDGLRRLLLSEDGFTVVGEASDGQEAVLLAAQLKPDVVLLDRAMLRLAGLAALRKLKRADVSIYTIVLTAAIQPFEVTSARAWGVHGIVLKASLPEILLESIRAVCKGEFWVGSDVMRVCARSAHPKTVSSALTSREKEIVCKIREGNSNKQVATQLSISEETVKRHLSNIYGKLGVSSRLQLAVLATRQDLAA